MSPHAYGPRLHPPRLLPVALTPVRSESEPRIVLGWPGLDPAIPTLDILLFDHSGSVIAPGGTDPIGRRFHEAHHAINTVQAWTHSPRPKVAVLHFDQPSTADSGVVALSATHAIDKLTASLRIPTGAAGASDLAPSLTAAEQLAQTHNDHQVRLTILSDFALTDDKPEEIFARLTAFPGRVHAVLLDAPAPPDLTGTNITITHVSPGDPPGALAAAIHRSLTATRRGRRHSTRTHG